MIPYLSCFITSLISVYAAKKNYDKKNKFLFLFFSMVALIIPSFLAGARATTVGTDTEVYTVPIFDMLKNNELSYAIRIQNNIGIEPGYLFLNFFVSRFTSDYHILLFIIQFIIIFLIYSNAMYNYKKNRISPVLYMLTYFFTFYNMTFNLTRQCIAVAIVIFASRYILDKKYFKFSLMVLLAGFFHSSAYISFFIILIDYFLGKKKKFLYEVFMIIGLIFITIFSQDIVKVGISIGIIPLKYANYLTKYVQTSFSFNFIDTLFKLFILFLYGVFRNILKENKMNSFYSYLIVFDVILMQIGMFMNYANRVSFFFGYMATFALFPQFASNIKINGKDSKLFIILVLIIYWCIYFIYQGNGQTYPYMT